LNVKITEKYEKILHGGYLLTYTFRYELQLAYVLDQLDEVIRYNFVIMGMLMQLLVVCYSGQKLLDESQNIFYQA